MNAKHTQGPYVADGTKVMHANDMDFVADCDSGNPADSLTDAANAEFIVRACNAHDDLLAALQALERAIANNEPFTRAEHEQARAAIAKAVQS